MAETKKKFSERDANQTLQHSYNGVDGSLTINGFLVGKVGRKVNLSVTTTTITDDTEEFSFSEDGILLYTLKIVYVDGARQQMISAERTA